MLNLSKSTISRSVERKTDPSTPVTAEGQALVAVVLNGEAAFRPSTGAAGEKFGGVSLAQQLTLEYLPFVHEAVVPADGDAVITLPRTPIAGTLRVVDTETGDVITAGDPAATANTYSITDRVLTMHADQRTHLIRVYFRFAPTLVEAKAMQGDIPPGGAAALLLDQVGAIEVGDVYTSEYDTTADWSAESPVVRLGPNGLFTTSGNGTILDAIVLQAPSGDDAFLGLRIK